MFYSIAFAPNMIQPNIPELLCFYRQMRRYPARLNFVNTLFKKFNQLYKTRNPVINFLHQFTPSGRYALHAILKEIKDQYPKAKLHGIVPVFTCSSVLDVFTYHSIPLHFAKIKTNFTYDISDLEHYLQTRDANEITLILFQHTFGYYIGLEQQQASLQKFKNIVFIEDLAHNAVLPPTQYTHFAFTSFGQEKFISAEGGGLLIKKVKHPVSKNASVSQNIPLFTYKDAKRLLKLFLSPFALKYYNTANLGKFIVYLLKVTKSINTTPKDFTTSSKALTVLQLYLLNQQLDSIQNTIRHKLELQQLYFNLIKKVKHPGNSQKTLLSPTYPRDQIRGIPLLRFPIYSNKYQCIQKLAKRSHIQIGTWYRNGLIVDGQDAHKNVQRILAKNPQYHWMSGHILQLPLHPNFPLKKAKDLVGIIKRCYNDN